MARKTKIVVAALATALSLGGLTAFAMGVSQTGSDQTASSLSGKSAQAKVIKIKKIKRVKAAVGSAVGTFAASGAVPSIQSPSQGSPSVRPSREASEGGWDDDGGEEYEEEEHEDDDHEGDDD